MIYIYFVYFLEENTKNIFAVLNIIYYVFTFPNFSLTENWHLFLSERVNFQMIVMYIRWIKMQNFNFKLLSSCKIMKIITFQIYIIDFYKQHWSLDCLKALKCFWTHYSWSFLGVGSEDFQSFRRPRRLQCPLGAVPPALGNYDLIQRYQTESPWGNFLWPLMLKNKMNAEQYVTFYFFWSWKCSYLDTTEINWFSEWFWF